MRRATILATAVATVISTTAANAQLIPPALMGGTSGDPVIGVAAPPNPDAWTWPSLFRPPIGCYFTRIRTNNRWVRAQICDYMAPDL
jgi:hypothetical protein